MVDSCSLCWSRHRRSPGPETCRQSRPCDKSGSNNFMRMDHQLDGARPTICLPQVSLFVPPYDPEARFSQKRSTTWTGYKVHLTESCDDDAPHLITDVQTTPAPLADCEMTPPIQASLAERQILPREQLLDMGYVTAEHLVNSQRQYKIDLVGPVA